MRTRLDIAYLGTPFEGWQVQARPGQREPRTVQGEIEKALAAILGFPVRIHGAGRTDAGVHADGQVAHFDLPAAAPEVPPLGLQSALNARLPAEIRITSVAPVPLEFHARLSAESKRYRYRYRRGVYLPPHAGLVESLVRESLDADAMREGAARLVGRRDFAPFSVTGSNPRTTVRMLHSLSVEEVGPLIHVIAVGDGFLRGMVRRLAGTLREVGRGKIRPEDVLVSPGPTAEARGLTLEVVFYPDPLAPGVSPPG